MSTLEACAALPAGRAHGKTAGGAHAQVRRLKGALLKGAVYLAAALTCALLENIEHKYRLVVFVLEKAEQQERVYIPCEHCFVWKDDGEYHFFKYASKEEENRERK